MSNKSRVILYAKKREEISKMGTYSFLDTGKNPEVKPEKVIVNHEEITTDELAKTKPDGVRTNTLSTSLDELMQEQQELDKKNETQNRKKEYRQNKEKRNFPWLPVLFLCLGLVILSVVILLILSFIGGAK